MNKLIKRLSILALLTIVLTAQADIVNVGRVNLNSEGGLVMVSLYVSAKSKKPSEVFILTSEDKYDIQTTSILITSDETRKIAALLIEAADLIDGTP